MLDEIAMREKGLPYFERQLTPPESEETEKTYTCPICGMESPIEDYTVSDVNEADGLVFVKCLYCGSEIEISNFENNGDEFADKYL